MTALDWPRLAATYGTPFVVLSRSVFSEQVRLAQQAWLRAVATSRGGLSSPPRLYFPLKANDCEPLLADLRDLGIGIDVSDARELRLALSTLRIPAEHVVLNGPGKAAGLLAAALRAGARIHVDSLSEAREILSVAACTGVGVARVGLRLRLFGVSKFGLSPADDELAALVGLLRSDATFVFEALHHHDPLVLNNRSLLARAVAALVQQAKRLLPTQDQRVEIDLGGGLDCASGDFHSPEEFVEAFRDAADEADAGPIQFAFELGRALVGSCGFVVTRIVRLKESGGRRWVFVDAGQNVIGGGHASVRCSAVSVVAGEAGPIRAASVAGPLCFSSDILAEDAELPEAVKEGDLLLVEGAGAYTVTTRWHGPGANPMLLLEHQGRIEALWRLRPGQPPRAWPSALRPLDDLFRLFFDDAVADGAARRDPDVLQGLSSGVNQLPPPATLHRLHVAEAAAFSSIPAYAGPRGPEEILAAALAFEGALVGGEGLDPRTCCVVGGAAQGIRRTLGYLGARGLEDCVVLGPQYPWVHDVIAAAEMVLHELLGTFADGYIPTAEDVQAHLAIHPRSAVFLTVPNNPSGTSPSPAWLERVSAAVASSGGHLIVDRSSEDLPFADWVEYTACSRIALDALGVEGCTLVVSPSKSRSCPGFRLGYVIGSARLVESISRQQYIDHLSLPRYGVSFVAGDLILRSLWWRCWRRGESRAEALRRVLAVTSDERSLGVENSVVHGLLDVLDAYAEECRGRLETIRASLRAFSAEMGSRCLGLTALHNGFNVIAEVAWSGDPLELARRLYLEAGVRLFPGSCFTTDGRALPGRAGGTTIRVSCAAAPAALTAAGSRLSSLLDRGSA